MMTMAVTVIFIFLTGILLTKPEAFLVIIILQARDKARADMAREKTIYIAIISSSIMMVRFLCCLCYFCFLLMIFMILCDYFIHVNCCLFHLCCQIFYLRKDIVIKYLQHNSNDYSKNGGYKRKFHAARNNRWAYISCNLYVVERHDHADDSAKESLYILFQAC